jgi:hypothetical protein
MCRVALRELRRLHSKVTLVETKRYSPRHLGLILAEGTAFGSRNESFSSH